MTENNLSEIHFRDETVIDQPVKKSVLQDAHELLQNSEDGTLRLVAQCDATHSGLLTNLRVYPGTHVRRGYKTYYSKDNGGDAEFDKPVLKHHEHSNDPIGRITGGQFIKLKTGDAFKNDFLTPDTPETGGRGSGVVRLTTEITETDAIAKIIDGRLVSVSSGHSSDSMTCSLCGKPLLDMWSRMFGEGSEDDCQHIPGRVYKDDDAKGLCFGITGRLKYHELSFVNIPGQEPARKIDWELVKMTDSSDKPLVLPSRYRGKKSDISSMVLMDTRFELDLLTEKSKRLDEIVVVSDAVAAKVISSVLGEDTSEDDAAHNAEPDQVGTLEGEGMSTSTRPGRASDASSKGKNSDSGDAIEGRQDSDSRTSRGVDRSNGRLGDASYGGKMADKNELSVDALQASIESLTQDKAEISKQLEEKTTESESLTAQVEAKDSEVSRLTDDMSTMQGQLAKDYATIVAQYRMLLGKPGTEELDEEEAKGSYIDELAKRSVESLRDSLSDLSAEYVKFCADEKTRKDSQRGDEGVDVTADRLDSPALVDADGDDGKNDSTQQQSASEVVDQALGI